MFVVVEIKPMPKHYVVQPDKTIKKVIGVFTTKRLADIFVDLRNKVTDENLEVQEIKLFVEKEDDLQFLDKEAQNLKYYQQEMKKFKKLADDLKNNINGQLDGGSLV